MPGGRPPSRPIAKDDTGRRPTLQQPEDIEAHYNPTQIFNQNLPVQPFRTPLAVESPLCPLPDG
jgi:hypothetical protein